MNRREALPAIIAGVVGSVGPAIGAEPKVMSSTEIRIPRCELLYQCDATLADAMAFGETDEGTRRVIPITGGKFSGPRLSGEVLPGGADWNLSRNDGADVVDASYYLRTHDGVLLRITNRGVGKIQAGQSSGNESFLMFTTPSFQAPKGKYEWLNSSVFIGTLAMRKDARNAVTIRVFQMFDSDC